MAVQAKYQYKKFIDKAALVALKLGPSRSAATSRSASTPIVNQKAPISPPIPSSTSVPSAISKPTETSATSLPPMRPSTVLPASSARSASQFVPQHAPQPNGVWSDLISLQEPPRNSSLPLQYQVAPATQTMSQLGANMTSNIFTSSLQVASPTSYYQPSFSQTPQTPSFSTPNAFMHTTPFSAVPTGFVTGPITPQLQQQFLQPQPIQAGPSLSVPQPMMQQPQFATPSPVILSTPSPAIGSFMNSSPQLPVPSPGVGYAQTHSTVTVNQPGVMMVPQVPMQSATGFMPGPMGYATGSVYQTQTGFGNTGQYQWGPL